MPEFLMNQKTGVVFVRTDRLAARKDMVPYDYEKKRPVSAIQAPQTQTPAADTPPEDDELEAVKESAAGLVKEWFGRDVSKVTKKDLADYAMDTFGAEIEEDSKLKMVLAIEKLGAQGE
jgi:hypothetical protein